MVPLNPNTQHPVNPNTPLPVVTDNLVNDPLSISNSNHPGMVLTTTPFNGGNFLGWSRNIKMALGAKLKLEFIVGSCVKPAVNDVNHQRWIRCDYMVTCWVLNSMITELCLDKLQNLNGLPVRNCGRIRECTCGILDKFVEMDSRSKLMKLSDEYESIRSQILGMDPLPNVNKAYYIASFRGKKDVRNGESNRTEFEKVCTGCNQEEYLVEQCFERIGYPDWYKGNKVKKGTRMAAQVSLADHMGIESGSLFHFDHLITHLRLDSFSLVLPVIDPDDDYSEMVEHEPHLVVDLEVEFLGVFTMDTHALMRDFWGFNGPSILRDSSRKLKVNGGGGTKHEVIGGVTESRVMRGEEFSGVFTISLGLGGGVWFKTLRDLLGALVEEEALEVMVDDGRKCLQV
ncbi:retrovirus-related pol polyprotein from transposon TNT 1-94 [Tanacetum coccineum]